MRITRWEECNHCLLNRPVRKLNIYDKELDNMIVYNHISHYIYIYYVIIFPKKGEERSTRRGRRARGVTYVFPEWIDCDGRRNE